MQKSTLVPFLRRDLDILFVGLNPAKGSSDKGHYFSVNQAFWNQLFSAGLITKQFSKEIADEYIFGDNQYNYNKWNYGITDLVTEVAESNSSKIRPTVSDVLRLLDVIRLNQPKTVVLLHGKVINKVLSLWNHPIPSSNSGLIKYKESPLPTVFYNIAFPHGNAISNQEKISQYLKLKSDLERT